MDDVADATSVPPALVPRKRMRQDGSRLRSIAALVLREVQALYGRSPGGYVWAILEPLGIIVLLAFGFSLLLRRPSLGDSFLLFYATGYLPFQLYGRLQQMVSQALKYSRSLLVYPVVTWFDAIVARVLLHSLTGLVVSALLLTGMIVVLDLDVHVDMIPVLIAFAVAIGLGTGVGMVNSVLLAYFPVWRTIWTIAMRPLMLASGVLFIYEDLPTLAQDVLWYNPLLHVTATARSGFFPTYDPQFVSPAFVGGTVFVLLFFGLLLVRRFNGRAQSR